MKNSINFSLAIMLLAIIIRCLIIYIQTDIYIYSIISFITAFMFGMILPLINHKILLAELRIKKLKFNYQPFVYIDKDNYASNKIEKKIARLNSFIIKAYNKDEANILAYKHTNEEYPHFKNKIRFS